MSACEECLLLWRVCFVLVGEPCTRFPGELPWYLRATHVGLFCYRAIARDARWVGEVGLLQVLRVWLEVAGVECNVPRWGSRNAMDLRCGFFLIPGHYGLVVALDLVGSENVGPFGGRGPDGTVDVTRSWMCEERCLDV
jgi:hypothetical protein